MSTFAVTRERIGETRPIPGADRIEIAALAGMDFQFVVGKGVYRPGDPVLYIPVDAVLPPSLITRLGLTGKLAGSEQNRVKTIVLRGAYSQGVVAPPDLVSDELVDPAEITRALGITKWDPPPNEVKDAILVRLPDGISAYDIESADRYLDIVERLLDRPGFGMEKLEGENAWSSNTPEDPHEAIYGMRNNTILPKDGCENIIRKTLSEAGIGDFARALRVDHKARATVYGEFLGPGCNVGNYYDLVRPTVRLFDIRIGHRFLEPELFLRAVERFFGAVEPFVAPILQAPDGTTLRAWLAGRTVKQASDGPSKLAPKKRREGIVWKPLTEERDDRIGRLILKQRSPAYLANTHL